MLNLLFNDTASWCALGLILGTPAAVVILGELIARLSNRNHPLTSTLKAVRNFVVPILACYLLLVYIVEMDRGSVFVRLLLTGLAISVLNAVLQFLNAVLFASVDKSTWHGRVPKLLREVARLILIMIGCGVALSSVWHVDLGRFLAALGVGSIVLGLALQEPLGNLFSGLILTFERPFELGDVIEMGNKTGEVVEVNWRSVHLLNGTDLMVIPNSHLAKNHFANFSRPSSLAVDSLELTFSNREPPNRVKQIILDVVWGLPSVLQQPGPKVRTVSHNPALSAITYKVSFYSDDHKNLGTIRDELLTRIWYAADRAGLATPENTQTSIQLTKEDVEKTKNLPISVDLLRPFRQFGLVDLDPIASQLNQRSIKRYARGERVMTEGLPFDGLYLILAGQACLTVMGQESQEEPVADLRQGDFFGEKSLLSCQISDSTVTAVTDLEVLILDGTLLHQVLEGTPRLAKEIGRIMELRRKSIHQIQGFRPVPFAIAAA